MGGDPWFAKSQAFHGTRNGLSNQNKYNNDILESQKDYEDPEYYYSRPPDLPQVLISCVFEIQLTSDIKFNRILKAQKSHTGRMQLLFVVELNETFFWILFCPEA